MNYMTIRLLLILDSQRYTKTLQSVFTGQKWAKTSKSTSTPVTAVKSTCPIHRSPQHHFKWCLLLSQFGNQFHHKLNQQSRIVLISRSCVVPVQVDSFHPNQTLAELFIDNIFQVNGLPKIIISDRDPKFTSKFWESMLKTLETELLFSTGDEQTDYLNQTLVSMLRQPRWKSCEHLDQESPHS